MAKGFHAREYDFAPTAVRFSSQDETLKAVYDKAERLLAGNEMNYNDRRLIREGATYPNVWLETQPLGGEMYAKRNFEVGLNNVLIFLQYQRKDGRFPGMISNQSTDRVGLGIVGHYDWIQGFYFAQPALKLGYLLGKDRGYLEKLYSALEDFDDYLWTHRDSDGDGCLEIWCCWDTAEDNCTRYTRNGAPDGGHGNFGGETAPYGVGKLPFESVEYMAYSYGIRDVLARISALLGNGKEDFWKAEAKKIQDKVRDCLWVEEDHACYDLDCDNQVIPCLGHTNLRCMYHNLFTQEMADDFLYYHLFNPEEFWTPCPITAIAVNNEYFENNPYNNWSGACQGLIYQRSLDAFHNYGHYGEAAELGRILVDLICREGEFHQQYDPFTGQHDPRLDGYGPMIFAFLEYLAYLQGVVITYDKAHWSNSVGGADSQYTQEMFGKSYTVTREGGLMTASLEGKDLFTATEGLRIITDIEGKPESVICIDEVSSGTVTVEGISYTGEVTPNGVYALEDGKLVKTGGAEYFKPGTVPVMQ